jgi:ATP-dependent RNA helicase RhlE
MPRAIKELADKYLTNPAEVSVTPAATTVERIDQSVTMVNQAEKTALLAMTLQSQDVERALVFSRTKHGADKIVRMLEAAGIASGAIHGNKSQANRERAIGLFKSGQAPVLIATDIAARGIDIPGVSHVVNFDLPDVPEQYVHRIGRTARAGADGIAIAFCSPDERGNLRDIERTTRQRIAVTPLPEGFLAAAEAFKRLKPAPKAAPERPQRPAFKADRRQDGQRRQHRHGGKRPQVQREEGTAVYRPTGAPVRNPGQRPQRNEGHSTPRADGGQNRNSGQQQRHPQRSGGHPAHRPEGGHGKPRFQGRRRFGGGNRSQG